MFLFPRLRGTVLHLCRVYNVLYSAVRICLWSQTYGWKPNLCKENRNSILPFRNIYYWQGHCFFIPLWFSLFIYLLGGGGKKESIIKLTSLNSILFFLVQFNRRDFPIWSSTKALPHQHHHIFLAFSLFNMKDKSNNQTPSKISLLKYLPWFQKNH